MKKNVITLVVIAVLLFLGIFGVLFITEDSDSTKNAEKKLERMVSRIGAEELAPVKGTVELSKTDLADELPDISKYPLSLEGNGDINVEIVSSPEKAGEDYDGWLLEVANEFN